MDLLHTSPKVPFQEKQVLRSNGERDFINLDLICKLRVPNVETVEEEFNLSHDVQKQKLQSPESDRGSVTLIEKKGSTHLHFHRRLNANIPDYDGKDKLVSIRPRAQLHQLLHFRLFA
eukprot:207099-Hanusia_phi.AAC.11